MPYKQICKEVFAGFLIGFSATYFYLITVGKIGKIETGVDFNNSRLRTIDRQIDELSSRLEKKDQSDNKLVKTIMDAATLTGIVAGIGWISKKVVKENFTSDPSSNLMNYVKFTVAMSASIAAKKYLEDQKILPN